MDGYINVMSTKPDGQTHFQFCSICCKIFKMCLTIFALYRMTCRCMRGYWLTSRSTKIEIFCSVINDFFFQSCFFIWNLIFIKTVFKYQYIAVSTSGYEHLCFFGKHELINGMIYNRKIPSDIFHMKN